MIQTTDYPRDIRSTVESLGELLGKPFDMTKVEIVDRGRPHKREDLKKGQFGIYIFILGDEALKIGHAEWNRRLWFGYQQYSPRVDPYTLASLILQDEAMKSYDLTEKTIARWMMETLRRIDVLVDESLGLAAAELIDRALNYKYTPRYPNTGIRSEAYGQWHIMLADRAILVEKNREGLYPWERRKNQAEER